jgi:hypothetical protein
MRSGDPARAIGKCPSICLCANLSPLVEKPGGALAKPSGSGNIRLVAILS